MTNRRSSANFSAKPSVIFSNGYALATFDWRQDYYSPRFEFESIETAEAKIKHKVEAGQWYK